jgi:hypothetical protein
MALREFTDSSGTLWRVWDVEPHDPRVLRAPEGRPRDGEVEGVAAGERRNGGHGLAHGWLCFEGPEEKRRLAPVPDEWHTMRDPELETLLSGARRVKRRER